MPTYDLPGVEALRDRYIAAFDINYDSEVLPGARLRVERGRLYLGEEEAAETYKNHLLDAGFRSVSVPEKGETVTL